MDDPVTKPEREYMRRIGEAKRASHERATAEHRALPVAERLRRSWALWVRFRDRYDWQRREDDPSHLYERAKRLGMYEP